MINKWDAGGYNNYVLMPAFTNQLLALHAIIYATVISFSR